MIKSARVSEFGGTKGLSSSYDTKIVTDYEQFKDEPTVIDLRRWKEKDYNSDEIQGISRESRNNALSTIEEINSFILPDDEKAVFDVTAYIGHVRTEGTNLFYPGCVNQVPGQSKCQRKATLISAGMILLYIM